MQNEEFLSVKSVKSLSTVASCPPELQRRRTAKADAVQFLLVAALPRWAFCAFFAKINLSHCP
jgi:hypothetical protein